MAGVISNSVVGAAKVPKQKYGASPWHVSGRGSERQLTRIARKKPQVMASEIDPWEMIEMTDKVFFPVSLFSPGGHSASASQGMFQYNQ